MNGICTLANDRVYHQLVALLNSIEVIYGESMPVCIYPYDDNLSLVREEISRRPYARLYGDGVRAATEAITQAEATAEQQSIAAWDQFVRAAWDTHPTARERWKSNDPNYYHRVGTHRRFCAFDGPFDRFIYLDADTLLISSVDYIFENLERHDFVVYDYQFKDPTHVYEVKSSKLNILFMPARVQTEIFCSGMYGSKRNLFDRQQRDRFLNELGKGDAEVLYPMAPDQTLLNYMVMKSGIAPYNYALKLPVEQRTGCCITSPHFEVENNTIYDRAYRLTYLHYIGLPSTVIDRVCAGENIDFPYRDLFLHYRYLHEPEQRPVFKGNAQAYDQPLSIRQRVLQKLGLAG